MFLKIILISEQNSSHFYVMKSMKFSSVNEKILDILVIWFVNLIVADFIFGQRYLFIK